MNVRPDIIATAGIVELVSAPDPTPLFGPASAYAYNVYVNIPNGESRTFENVIPSLERWPDTMNVVPFQVNKPVPVVLIGTPMGGYEMFILARELPHTVGCTA